MDAPADIDLDCRVASVGVLLLAERLDVPVTGLVVVINDPRLALLA
jgi:hypothetical protein